MGTRPPFLVIVVAASIVLVAAVAAWYPQRAVAIVVRPERTVYVPGESGNFTLVLKAEGNRPINVVDFSGPLCGNVYFAVEDEGGRTIIRGSEGIIRYPVL